jgi:polysaccharide deacetylase 2 family uncharacterized protein YibQ
MPPVDYRRNGSAAAIRSPVRLRWVLLGLIGISVCAMGSYMIGLALQTGEEQEAPRIAYRPAPPPAVAPRVAWPEFGPPPASEEPPPPAVTVQSAPPQTPLSTPKSQPQIAALPAMPPQIVQPQIAPPQIPPLLPPIPEGPEGEAPWLRYGQAARPSGGRPEIAIVIDDVGLDRHRSARAIAMPAPLTLSFLPYAEDLHEQTSHARSRGHELLVHVPMEPLGSHNDAGPGALKVALSQDDIAERLRRDLTQFDRFVGINNHMGSRFTAYEPGMAIVMAELKARGLLFLDSRTIGNTVGAALADRYGVPNIERDVFLDDVMTESAVRAELARLEAIAQRTGHAVAIGHPHDQTLNVLARWMPDAQARGFVLVPLSQLVRERRAVAPAAATPIATIAKPEAPTP